MEFLWKIVKPIAIRRAKRKLNDEKWNDNFKRNIVEKLNKKIDLPKLSEADEAKLLNNLYDAIHESSLDFLEKL